MSKKVFISYSWGTKEHQEWVINLGKRLMSDSVDVVLDRWSLKDGNDIFHFMESMVNADDIYRVLVVCDKNYKNKSDNRDGGVGTETQIITPEIYSNQKQEKFIPLVLERDENGSPYLPIFLSTRKYLDFSNEEYFEDSYEELLRNILDAPAIPKPKLGTKIPTYITEELTNNYATNSLLRVLENQLKKNPEKINNFSQEFIETFLDSLWDFEFKGKSHTIKGYGEELVNNLVSFKVLREDFIDFLKTVTKVEFNLDVEVLIEFFEKAPDYNRPRKESRSWSSSDFENFKIIFQELFIYTIAIAFKNRNYNLIGELLYSKFYIKDVYKAQTVPNKFTFLYNYNDNLENYYRGEFNKITGFGHYVITNLSEKVKRNDIVFADTLCHYIAELYSNGDYRDSWFPCTYLYKEGYFTDEFYVKLSSQRHFEKVKSIFNVDTISELKEILNKYQEVKKDKDRIRFGRSFDTIPFAYEIIKIEEIGTNK